MMSFGEKHGVKTPQVEVSSYIPLIYFRGVISVIMSLVDALYSR